MRSRIVTALLLFVVAGSVAARSESPEALLRRLYAAHQPWAHKDALRNESLASYFDATLVRLIRADRDCKAPDWGVGNLDFDPVLSAQDFGDGGIGDLQFRRISGAPGEKYEVSFLLFPGVSDARTRLVYSLVKTSSHWRIADIQYEKSTLLRILARPCG